MDDDHPLRDKLRLLPPVPGVYLMKDRRGKVIYVGKAARLSQRVRSYFAPPQGLDPKTASLATHIADFDYVVTGSEREALLLESQFVKEYKPRYNIRLKDDKRYPWLRLTLHEPYPRVEIVRQARDDQDEYFGPFTDSKALRLALKTLTSIFPVRTCTLDLPGERVPRPCLDYYIHRCCAPCVDYVTRVEYAEVVERVRLFLQGHSRELLMTLQERMEAHASALRFEDAGRVRDTIRAVRKVVERQEVVLPPGSDVDVLGLTREGREACGVVLRVRDGKLVQTERYLFGASLQEDAGAYFERFCAEVFGQQRGGGRAVLLSHALADQPQWEEVLSARRGQRVTLRVPRRGAGLRLTEMAVTNARFKLRERQAKGAPGQAARNVDVPEILDLKQRLGLPVAPHSIECFDMSHFQGDQRVGALVYLQGGAPLKSRYRRFRIRQVEGIDDFAMMQEVLERYYSRLREEDRLPADLVLVDGGAGQLAVALRTLRRYGFMETACVGLAKREEELYLPGRPEPLRLPRSSPGLKLLQRARDEAHRFAVGYHRRLRDRETVRSILDEIPGIGAAKKRALLLRFGSAEAVGSATMEALLEVAGVGAGDAERIAAFFLARREGP
jgi:excinuclease ABC subunit C